MRTFLFLQGVCSPFFARLADALEKCGHRVLKVNFNVGDSLYWPGRKAWNFRGPVAGLNAFLYEKYIEGGVTDQVLFGDCRPVHLAAVQAGRKQGVRTHVFEEGYFRPHWVTLEREGVNTNSLMPRDPEWFLDAAARLPEVRKPAGFVAPFSVRALHDVLYHCASALNPLLYPGYRTHAPVSAALQYLGYVRRLPMLSLYHKRRDQRLLESLPECSAPFFFLPLQLDGDSQIRFHSSFADMKEVMRHVMRSFALHAPAKSRLLIKNHPLDLGLAGHGRVARYLAEEFGVASRIDFIETGDLALILKHAAGTVTVNSTVGSVALGAGCPTVCLADPIYNLAGLTFQGGLDAFWMSGERPDARLFAAFRRTVIHAAQINGGFYCAKGIALAVANAVPRLLAEMSPMDVLTPGLVSGRLSTSKPAVWSAAA